MNKNKLTEQETRTRYILPAILQAGWDSTRQLREEVSFTDGRIIVQGNLYARGKGKQADFILYYRPNIPIAIVEAKRYKQPDGTGMQQAMQYAEILDVPFAFCSSGRNFHFHDYTTSRETVVELDDFPGPDELWEKYLAHKGIADAPARAIVEQPYYIDTSGMQPRYYQQIAINRTIEAISKGENRALLVMATGTGKTYTAFNIIWRLWKAGIKKRILFLADRNILVDQTKTGDFAPFGSDIMHTIRHRKIDKAYQIYFALYQGLTGQEESKRVYKEFSPDFFDLIVIDECHRGSAREDSEWKEILHYFSSATQIGLTATPKETKAVSNIDYFGEPIYVYSLVQGIDDGFLAPYKVVRVSTTVDDGWRPTENQLDRFGNEIADRIYNLRDYDRNLVIDNRTQVVAERITEFLKKTDRFAKTIVFCVDIEHANRMRMALINLNADLVAEYPKYVVKITGDDKEGKAELDNFIDVESRFPVIATTSKLLTTGVNTKMVKLIVIDANIGSMTEFKQIIGRGSRLREEDGKVYFTIVDFRRASAHFADPNFDGPPIQEYEVTPDDPIVPPDAEEAPSAQLPEADAPPDTYTPPDVSMDLSPDTPRKIYVDGVQVSVAHERVQYYGQGGKLITESIEDYTRQRVRDKFATAKQFIKHWNEADKKKAVIDELTEQGVLIEALREQVGRDLDPFDLICHIAYDRPALTRKERAGHVRRGDYFAAHGELAQRVIHTLLDKYEALGIGPLEEGAVLHVRPLNELGSPVELVRAFGGKAQFDAAIKTLETQLYKSA